MKKEKKIMKPEDIKRVQTEQIYYSLYGVKKSFDEIIKDRLIMKLKSENI